MSYKQHPGFVAEVETPANSLESEVPSSSSDPSWFVPNCTSTPNKEARTVTDPSWFVPNCTSTPNKEARTVTDIVASLPSFSRQEQYEAETLKFSDIVVSSSSSTSQDQYEAETLKRSDTPISVFAPQWTSTPKGEVSSSTDFEFSSSSYSRPEQHEAETRKLSDSSEHSDTLTPFSYDGRYEVASDDIFDLLESPPPRPYGRIEDEIERMFRESSPLPDLVVEVVPRRPDTGMTPEEYNEIVRNMPLILAMLKNKNSDHNFNAENFGRNNEAE